jgi:hypothetical protein
MDFGSPASERVYPVYRDPDSNIELVRGLLTSSRTRDANRTDARKLDRIGSKEVVSGSSSVHSSMDVHTKQGLSTPPARIQLVHLMQRRQGMLREPKHSPRQFVRGQQAKSLISSC